MTACRLLLDEPAGGAWNMAVDEVLLEQTAAQERPTLRLYRWREPTVSLGYFQPYESRRQHAASRDCPLVRRLSGGGAIVHDREITYCLTLPLGHPLAAQATKLFQVVHRALADTLATLGLAALVYEAEVPSGEATEPLKEPFLCFSRRATGDLLVGDVKVAGSAQRRRKGAILQHGSLLLGASRCAPELAGLDSLGLRPLDWGEWHERLAKNLARGLQFEYISAGLSAEESARAAGLAADKYGGEEWSRRK